MDCTETRALMLAARRGLLPAEQASAVRAHAEECRDCRAADAADVALSGALARLPRKSPSDALRTRLEARWAPRARRWPRVLAPIAAAAALSVGIAAAAVLIARSSDRADRLADDMFTEMVNDHLRVLYSEHPVEIESGGIHQVKPWFSGKLDFAPAVSFAGDEEFPLKGGSVAYFMDRKAAAFVFARRLHMITLFVFRSEGLPWPEKGGDVVGSHRMFARSSRGFHAMAWRDGDLGYAIVSDVAEGDLRLLAERVAGAR